LHLPKAASSAGCAAIAPGRAEASRKLIRPGLRGTALAALEGVAEELARNVRELGTRIDAAPYCPPKRRTIIPSKSKARSVPRQRD
jgi:hypothetical protein